MREWTDSSPLNSPLRSREFEPDGPNYTPRISGVMHVEDGKFNYAMSILKSNNGNPDSCLRYTFAYENAAQDRDVLSILINAMEIHFQASRESRS